MSWIPTSRTFWINALSLAGLFFADQQIVDLLGPNGLMWALKAQAAINILLRLITTGPMQTLGAK